MEGDNSDGNVACVLSFQGRFSEKCNLILLDKTLEKHLIAEIDFRYGCGIACVEGTSNVFIVARACSSSLSELN